MPRRFQEVRIMWNRRNAAPVALTLAMAVWVQPTMAQNRQINAVSGIVQLDGSCPGSTYILADCPCLNPTILYHLDSTKVDLAAYAGHFVTLRGTVREPGCQAPFFEVRKATIEPDRPCPCPASGATVAAAPDHDARLGCTPSSR